MSPGRRSLRSGHVAKGWRLVVSGAMYRVSRTLDTEARRAVRKLRAKATFMEIAYARCKSVRTSFLALRFLVEWGRLSDRNGHELPIVSTDARSGCRERGVPA